jgi:hypothetical protein
MSRSPVAELQHIQAQLQALREGQLSAAAFCQAHRDPEQLLSALPPAFKQVWQDHLDRLESSANFAEESCSFSAADLLDGLTIWIEKAQSRLTTSA